MAFGSIYRPFAAIFVKFDYAEIFAHPTLVKNIYIFYRRFAQIVDLRNRLSYFFYVRGSDSRFFYVVGVDFKYNEM